MPRPSRSVAAETAAVESVAAEAATDSRVAAEAATDSRVAADGDAAAGIGPPSTGAEGHPDADTDGVAAPRRHTRAPYAPLPVRVALSGLALLAALSWLPPYLGERAAERAVSAAAAGELTLAVREAETARARDPLAVRPLMTLALVQQQLGQGRAALATLDEAAALQPQNPDVHYQRGLVLLNALGRPQEAADAFVRALELDPLDDITAFQLSVALREVRRAGG